MAGSDSQKQFLTLIRNFATEKSQGERRVVGLRKQIEELRSEVEAANVELEDAKRGREATEQELKGYEVELARIEASIHTLQSRIYRIQDEISTIGSDIEAFKSEEGALRDEFLRQMYELNNKIRKFHETVDCNLHKECNVGTVAGEQSYKNVRKEVTEVALTTLEDMVSHVISQTTKEEEEYQTEQDIQKQIQKEVNDCEKKVSLIEAIMKTTGVLKDLTRYPY
ncbi:hypothetical protein UlMin_014892 [Ulmus minor]